MNNDKLKKKIQEISFWLTKYLKLDKATTIEVKEKDNENTPITLIYIKNTNTNQEYTIKKNILDISIDDIESLPNTKNISKIKKLAIRFIGIWIAFAGLYTVFNVCPVCGQMGCPVGMSVSVVIGGIAAFILQGFKMFKEILKLRVKKLNIFKK